MVERGGLENRCGCKPTQGSNPCLSAISFFNQNLVASKSLILLYFFAYRPHAVSSCLTKLQNIWWVKRWVRMRRWSNGN